MKFRNDKRKNSGKNPLFFYGNFYLLLVDSRLDVVSDFSDRDYEIRFLSYPDQFAFDIDDGRAG